MTGTLIPRSSHTGVLNMHRIVKQPQVVSVPETQAGGSQSATERSVARPTVWQIFRRARCSPNRLSSISAAVLTLERQH
jgi:hypothetical protein